MYFLVSVFSLIFFLLLNIHPLMAMGRRKPYKPLTYSSSPQTVQGGGLRKKYLKQLYGPVKQDDMQAQILEPQEHRESEEESAQRSAVEWERLHNPQEFKRKTCVIAHAIGNEIVVINHLRDGKRLKRPLTFVEKLYVPEYSTIPVWTPEERAEYECRCGVDREKREFEEFERKRKLALQEEERKKAAERERWYSMGSSNSQVTGPCPQCTLAREYPSEPGPFPIVGHSANCPCK